jgi:hypothetical protein
VIEAVTLCNTGIWRNVGEPTRPSRKKSFEETGELSDQSDLCDGDELFNK